MHSAQYMWPHRVEVGLRFEDKSSKHMGHERTFASPVIVSLTCGTLSTAGMSSRSITASTFEVFALRARFFGGKSL